MRLVSFSEEGRAGFGRLEGEEVVELNHGADLRTALAQGADLAADGPRIALSSVELAPPIPNPAKVFCIEVNYVEHRNETGRSATDNPTVFTRFADTLVAHGRPLVRPLESVRLDYEAELAVVIGKGGRRIAEHEAMNHVAGYACFNDGSVRDWQRHTSQFTPGKNFPGTGGFGPWLTTADEVPVPAALTVTLRLNGEVLQHAAVSDLIFPIPRLIAYLSAFTELSPGDVISTGTPGGVGAQRQPPIWMKPGDVAEVDIPGVGLLRNTVMDG